MSRTREQIAADRARYEQHQQKGLEFAPRALPGPSPLPPPPIAVPIHEEVIAGGWYFGTRLRRGEALRIARTHGPASVAMMAWNADDPSERLNLPDTIKVQWTTTLGRGRVIFSDMGRVMFSVIADSSGAHDGLMGGSTAASNAARYPGQPTRNTRDNLLLVASKFGLDVRDMTSILTFFAPVRVAADGAFAWHPDLLNGADYVDLRAEMDLLVALSNCPHPLDPAPHYDPPPVTVTRFRAATPEPDDLCRTATAEAIRGFANNARAEA